MSLESGWSRLKRAFARRTGPPQPVKPVKVLPKWVRYPLLVLLFGFAALGLVFFIQDPGEAAASTPGRVFVPVGEGLALLVGAVIVSWVARRRAGRLTKRLERLARVVQARGTARPNVDDLGTSALRAVNLLRAQRTEEALAELDAIARRRDELAERGEQGLVAAVDDVVEETARMERTHRRLRRRAERVEERRRRTYDRPVIDPTKPSTADSSAATKSSGVEPLPRAVSPLGRLLDELGPSAHGDDRLGRWLRRTRLDRSGHPADSPRLHSWQLDQLLAWVERTAPAVVRAQASGHDRPDELGADAAYVLAWAGGVDDEVRRRRVQLGSLLRFCVETAGFAWEEVLSGGCDPAGVAGEGRYRELVSVRASLPSAYRAEGAGVDFVVVRVDDQEPAPGRVSPTRIEVVERSAGVYEATATTGAGRTILRQGEDPEELVESLRREVATMRYTGDAGARGSHGTGSLPTWASQLGAGTRLSRESLAHQIRRSRRRAESATAQGGLSASQAGHLRGWAESCASDLARDGDPGLAADVAFALAWVATGVDDERDMLLTANVVAYAATQGGVDWSAAVADGGRAAGASASTIERLARMPRDLPPTHEWRGAADDRGIRPVTSLLPHTFVADADTSLVPLAERLLAERDRLRAEGMSSALLDPVLDRVVSAANFLIVGQPVKAREVMDVAAYDVVDHWPRDDLASAVLAQAQRLRRD